MIKFKRIILCLSLVDLKERAEAIASKELLDSISGGTANACHDKPKPKPKTESTANTIYGPWGF